MACNLTRTTSALLIEYDVHIVLVEVLSAVISVAEFDHILILGDDVSPVNNRMNTENLTPNVESAIDGVVA